MTDALRYFGTDGVRGPALEGPLSLENASRWGCAWAEVARSQGITDLVMGWDPRLSSEPLAKAFLAGVDGRLQVRILGVVPTPAVAWLVSRHPNAWGLMISASHNPPEDNGLKGFGSTGEKLSESDEQAIETAFDAASPVPSLNALPESETSLVEAYLDHLGALPVAGLKVVIDCAHGATAPWAPQVFHNLEVSWLGTPAEGARINVGVGSTHLEALQRRVRETGADLGIAFDGDGDRCLLVDAEGTLVDGDQLVWLLARSMQASGEAVPGVVGTVMSNAGLEEALRAADLPFVRTQVGDKHMSRELAQRNWFLAAEASGHIIQRQLGPSGDGLATALAALRALAQEPAEARWAWRFQPWPLELVNLTARDRRPLVDCQALEQARLDLSGRHGEALRLVLRWSGTEPKLRLMSEARTPEILKEAMTRLVTAARTDLAI